MQTQKGYAMPELRAIPLDQISPPARVLRATIPHEELVLLAESIRAVGLLQPIGVVQEGERYRLVWGHRRYLAHRHLGRTTIDAMVATGDEATQLEASATENIQRHDLNAVEEALAVKHMHEAQGRSVRQIAAALGRSDSWVRGRLEMLLWPTELIELVAQGHLTPAVARELVLVEEDRYRTLYTRAAIENGVTAAQARLWRQEWETLRAYQGEAPTDGPMEAPEATVQIPQMPCAVCDGMFPHTAFIFVRTCPGCMQTLSDAKRGR